MEIMNPQPETSPLPYSILQGEKINVSGFNTTHRKFATTPKDKYQDQYIRIQLIQKYYNITA